RLKDDLTPACAKSCPTASIQFGDLEELQARARRRLGELKARGEAKAQLYGMPESQEAAEVGPLHAFFLLLDKPQIYNLPEVQRFGSTQDRRVAADGFYLAAMALVPCAPLLIADLGRPDRFHHMLRIFKPLSPMNLGAWTLTGFTPVAFLRAASQAADTGLLRG